MAISGTVRRTDMESHIAGYAPEENIFVATKVFPIWEVRKDSDEITVIDAGQIQKNPGNLTVTPGAPWKIFKQRRRQTTYLCKKRAVGVEVPIDEAEFTELQMEDERNAAELAVNLVEIEEEQRAAGYLSDTTRFPTGGIFGTDVSSARWTDPTTNIVQQIADQQKAHRAKRGVWLDTLVLPWDRLSDLSLNESIQKLFPTTADLGVHLPLADLATKLHLKQILTPRVSVNMAPEDAEEEDMQDVWDSTQAWLVKTVEGRNLAVPQTGRTFVNTAKTPAGYYIEEERKNLADANIISAKRWDQLFPVIENLGHRFEGIAE